MRSTPARSESGRAVMTVSPVSTQAPHTLRAGPVVLTSGADGLLDRHPAPLRKEHPSSLPDPQEEVTLGGLGESLVEALRADGVHGGQIQPVVPVRRDL